MAHCFRAEDIVYMDNEIELLQFDRCWIEEHTHIWEDESKLGDVTIIKFVDHEVEIEQTNVEKFEYFSC